MESKFFELSQESKEALLIWCLTSNVGTSSKTMAMLAMNVSHKENDHFWRFDIPSDASDFRRCKALVDEVPQIKEAFPFIKEKFPRFGPILDNWDELCALLSADGTGCYHRIKELYPACMEADGFVKTAMGWERGEHRTINLGSASIKS